jgi:formate hydrogenlyase subunit 5
MSFEPTPLDRSPAADRMRRFLEGRFRGALEQETPTTVVIRLPLGALDRAAGTLAAEGARFVSAFVADKPARSLHAVFAFRGRLVGLRAELDGSERAYPALSLHVPAARLAERELHDREGLTPLGHPDLRRALRPDPDGFEQRVVGDDAFVIPYGPIRSGIFEAVQHIVETAGEDVLALETRPFFKHRALEERFAGLSHGRGALVAERVAGVAAVAHALAFAQAVESALGVSPPEQAELWRAVHAELERVANHLDVATKLAEDAALAVGVARFGILKEDVMRLRARLCGSRFGRGAVVPGGIGSHPLLAPEDLAEALHELERELARDRRLLLRTASFTDRLIGTGRLDRKTVEELAGLGPVARAAGVSTDARFERPYGAYRRLGFEVVTAEDGDALARLEVRFGEIRESVHLIRQALDRLRRAGDGPLRSELPAADGTAFGWTEAPQGELVYRIEVEAGTLGRVHVSSPSLHNWPLFVAAFRGDVLTDFSFIEHSFGLTPAGADR